MEHRLRPVRSLTLGSIAVALAACGPWIGFWTFAPLTGAAVAFYVADRLRSRTRFPEYTFMAAWVVAQIAIGAGVALSGGPESPALPLLAIPIVSLAARFSMRGIVAGVAATLVVMLLGTLLVEPQGLRADPALTILSAVLVISVGVLSTALMRSDIQYRNEAVLDQLTGLLNRKALANRVLELEQQSALVDQPIGLIVVDIDHFKHVNDHFGHARGDAVLAGVATLLRTQLRAFDFAYRIGGEEFLVLQPGAGVSQTIRFAEHLRETIAETPVSDGTISVTVSAGVSGSSGGSTLDYARAFAEADAALFAAKQAGRNCVRHFATKATAAPPLHATAVAR